MPKFSFLVALCGSLLLSLMLWPMWVHDASGKGVIIIVAPLVVWFGLDYLRRLRRDKAQS